MNVRVELGGKLGSLLQLHQVDVGAVVLVVERCLVAPNRRALLEGSQVEAKNFKAILIVRPKFVEFLVYIFTILNNP